MRKPRPRRLRPGSRRILGGAFIAALILAVAAAPAGAAASAPNCKSRQAVDYAAPLAKMPGARPLREGELPFGPRNFSVATLGWSHVALVGTSFGYTFDGKDAPYRVLDLGWRTTATAWAVDRHGQIQHKLGTREWTVGKVKELSDLILGFPAERPGFVRVDVRISSLAGHRLGAYRDYFRVLARSNDVAIAIDRATVHPGEAIVGQVLNRGAGHVSSRTALLEVERFVGGGWEVVPQPPSPESITGYGLFLGPGEAWRCHSYSIPADATPGRYRLATTVSFANLKQQKLVARAFEVVP